MHIDSVQLRNEMFFVLIFARHKFGGELQHLLIQGDVYHVVGLGGELVPAFGNLDGLGGGAYRGRYYN